MPIDPHAALRAAMRNEQQRPIDEANRARQAEQAAATKLQALVDTFFNGIADKGYAGSQVVKGQAGWLLRVQESNTMGYRDNLYLLANGTFYDPIEDSIKTISEMSSSGLESAIQSLIDDPWWKPQY